MSPALAQEAEDETKVQDTIVVTGSLIKRDGYDDRSPVQVIDREEFDAQGFATVTDIARNLTVNSGSVLVAETGDLTGVAQFNIRGLGLGSTLTLINGRRGGISPVSDGGGNEFFDINQLPLSMIQRIDFQTDGASATYGSQAVSGVANIITRRGFEGFELSARFEDATNQAGSISFAAGNSFDRGFLNAYGTYYKQTRNDRTDLGFLQERILPLVSSTGQPGSYVGAVTDPTSGVISRLSTSTIADPNCEAAGGILSGSRCHFDFSDQLSVIPEEDRLQFFSEGEYELTDSVTFYGEASFSRNRVKRTQGPGLYQNGLVDNGAIFVPGDHPFNFFVADPAASTGIRYVDPSEWDNAIHTGVDVVAIARPLGEELNGKGNADDRLIALDYWRGVAGLSFDLNDSWTADVSYQYAVGEREFTAPFNFIADNINQLAIDGLWNPFGSAQGTPHLVSPKDGVSVAGNTDSIMDQLSTTEVALNKSQQYTVDGVVTGDLFELPSGAVAAAFGAQYRAEEFSFTPDPLKAAAGSESRDPQFGASGEQSVYSIFGETILPVTDQLELQVALRFEDYGDQGGTTTDPKIALRYQPADWLALRGSYGTSFQAPTARQTSAQISRQVFDDPVSIDPGTGGFVCGASRTQISGELRVAGGEGLKPQSARNFNLGAIFNPASGLKFSVDYFNFDYEDLITPDEGAQAIIENDCADDGIPNDPRVERDASGAIRRVNSSFINTGQVKTDGIDLGADYTFSAGEFGDINLATRASWINKFEVRENDDAVAFDAVGSRNFRNQFRSLPEWRVNFTGMWFRGPHRITGTVRYIDSYLNDQNDEQIDSSTTLDLQYALELEGLFSEKPTNFSIGANNVFDKDPPTLGDGVRPGYDEEVHSIRGRILYVSVTQAF